MATAVESLQGIDASVALVVGAEAQNTVSARQGGDYLARAAHYRSALKSGFLTSQCNCG